MMIVLKNIIYQISSYTNEICVLVTKQLSHINSYKLNMILYSFGDFGLFGMIHPGRYLSIYSEIIYIFNEMMR